MQIIGIAKPASSGNQNIIVSLTEVEADMITGVTGKQHIAHRYRAGAIVDIGKVYNQVEWVNQHTTELRVAMAAAQISAAEIEDSLPVEQP